MITYLRGTLEEMDTDTVTVDVHGVGYAVSVSARTAASLPGLGSPLRLYIHEYLREAEHTLYGFPSPQERQLFQMVLAVNGVGPRTALNVLSTLSADEFVLALQEGDVIAFARAPGVGRKTAQRIVLELQSKVGVPFTISPIVPTGIVSEAIQTLIALGASDLHAEKAVLDAKKTLPEEVGIEALVTTALRSMGR